MSDAEHQDVEQDQDQAQGQEEGDEQEVPTDEDGNQLAPDGSTVDEVEADREERLDPDNRPEGAEIDNTDRTFDEATGMFEDSEGADDAEPQYATASDDD